MLAIALSLWLTGMAIFGLIVFFLTCGFAGRLSTLEAIGLVGSVLIWPVTLSIGLVRARLDR